MFTTATGEPLFDGAFERGGKDAGEGDEATACVEGEHGSFFQEVRISENLLIEKFEGEGGGWLGSGSVFANFLEDFVEGASNFGRVDLSEGFDGYALGERARGDLVQDDGVEGVQF
ncbi:MAG: hypothetical protein ABS99_01070 [Acetobacteraceae bacterium SCN 69-10]|nr:MAG: hypothetical protein ABS99_01070 [Acetobacteraceae bacterium SCN 69-10]